MINRNTVLLLCLSAGLAGAQSDYDAGSRFAHEQKGQGTGAIQNMDPEAMIPGYTANPPEGGYYGGVQAGAAPGLENAGAEALHNTDAGNTVIDVIKNRPPDRPDLDAPFISNGLTVRDNAETITGGTDVPCKDVTLDKTDITTHYCERSPAVQLACTRKAVVNFKEKIVTTTETKTWAFGDGGRNPDHYSRSGDNFTYVFPYEGRITGAIWASRKGVGRAATVTSYLFGTSVTYNTRNAATAAFYPVKRDFRQGEHFVVTHPGSYGSVQSITSYPLRITLTIEVDKKEVTYEPYIEWVENCPFDKSQEVKLSTQCTEAGGTRTVEYGGKQYPVYSDCWQYTDTYISQEADNGSCDALMNDPACTLAKTTCTEQSGAACLREQAVFSCEKKISAAGQLCGMDLVCTSGECDQINSGSVNDFQHAVSALAAVAAAGEDVAALNDEMDIRAFTGQGQSCRKAAAGFSNCCKNSGWGNDVGLAGCDSEEKAIGKAKDRKLAVYVGTYCSNKVLGVCLQKKEGYCVFDSKLAKIVQEQGRSWQLGIGFGSGNNPDCRGITIDELQAIDFDRLNFADFYEDMESGTDIPADQELIDRVKEQISSNVQRGTQP
ncbi:TPA: type-F conjugative transfer system mating-pair stabilization protein TraN [Morganella morganii]